MAADSNNKILRFIINLCTLSKIDDWLTVNKLSLNIDKTKFMIFSKPGSYIPPVIPSIRQVTIEKVSEFNFLGVLIDESLTWKSHINKISSKISKGTGILCRLKNLLPEKILLNIYNALILPYLNYAILIWGFSNTHRLLLLQKKAVRSITNSTYYATTPELFKHLQLLVVDDIFLYSMLKFYFKLENNKLPSYFSTFIHEKTQHGKNTRFSELLPKSTNQKKYCDQCVRYGLITILNHPKMGSTSIDTNIYVTNFMKNKLVCKPAASMTAILEKVHTHTFSSFGKYVKLVFLQLYTSIE